MPDAYESYLGKKLDPAGVECVLKCVASNGVPGLRHSIGYLLIRRELLLFLTRRWFRFRTYETQITSITDFESSKIILFNIISFSDETGLRAFYFFKDSIRRRERALSKLVR
jgi:hypothetical protein